MLSTDDDISNSGDQNMYQKNTSDNTFSFI